MKHRAFLVLAFVSFSTPALAEMSADTAIKEFHVGNNYAFAFLGGIGVGYTWANTHLQNTKKPLLFCAPQNIALTVVQEVDLMEQYISHHPGSGVFPAGNVMLGALMEAFPCRYHTGL